VGAIAGGQIMVEQDIAFTFFSRLLR